MVGPGLEEYIMEEVGFQWISKKELDALRSLCSEFPAFTTENVNIEGCQVGRRQSPLNKLWAEGWWCVLFSRLGCWLVARLAMSQVSLSTLTF